MKTFNNVAIASFIALGLLAAPTIALADNTTGSVVWVRTCPDGAGGQKIVIRMGNDSNLLQPRNIYLGVEAAGSTSLTSIVMGAYLSGRKVRVEHSTSGTTQCGLTNALYANSTNHWIQAQN